MVRTTSSRRRRILITLEVLLVLVIGVVAVWLFLRPDEDERRHQRSLAAAAAFKAGDFEKSALHYRALLKDSPRHFGLQMNLVACLIRMNRLDEATAMARKVLELEPTYAPAHKILSDLAWSRGEVSAAIEEARLATEGRLVAENSRLILADRLIAAGQSTEGVEVLAGEVSAERGGAAAIGRLVPWVTGEGPKGAAFVHAEGKLRQAYRDAQGQFSKTPESSDALEKFVRLGLMAGEVHPPLDALEEAGKTRDLAVEEKLLLARLLAAAGEVGRAREYLDTFDEGPVEERIEAWLGADAPGRALSALDAMPDAESGNIGYRRLELRILLHYARSSGGVASEAEVSRRIVDTATAILDVYPGDETALAARSPALLTQGQVLSALEDALALRRIAPGNPAGRWLQGLALMASGRAASARLLLAERGDELQPGDERWVAEASVRVGDGAAALRDLDGYTGIAATALRVAALALTGDVDGACGLAETREFQDDPLRERLLAAKILALREKPEIARGLIEELGTIDASVGPLLETGDLHLAMGDRVAARAALEAASSPGGPVAIAALGRLLEMALAEKPPDEAAAVGLLSRLRSLEGGVPVALSLEGRLLLTQNKPEKALELADEVLAENPEELAARVLKLAALLAMGETGDRVNKAAESVLEILPGHGPARLVRAQRLVDGAKSELASGRVSGVSDSLTAAVDLIPGASEALFLRGIVSVSAGEMEAAEEDAKLLMESPGGVAPGNYLAGVLRMQQGKIDEAAASFRVALDAEPESGVAAAGLAGALLGKGELQEALDLSDTWLARDPQVIWAVRTKAFALAGLGRAVEGATILRDRAAEDKALLPLRMMAGWLLFQSGKHAAAAAEFDAVVAGQPLNVRARALQLEACLAAEDMDGAGQVVERAMTSTDLGAVGLLLRARLKSAEGDTDGAANDLRQAVVVAPEDPVARFLLGEILAKTGNIDDARNHLERAAALLPGAAQPRLTLALIASEQGRDRDAVKLYEEVLALQPGNALAANNLAHHLTGSPAALPERAVELARLAVSVAPKYAPFHDTLAVAFAAAGDYDDACKAADRALELDDTRPSIQVNAARIHRDAGNIERAREIAKLVLEAASEEQKTDLQRRIDELELYPVEEEPDDG